MLDNHFATALVIGSVLALMSAVYLSTAVGTPYWFEYHSRPVRADNVSEEFEGGKGDEFLNSRAMTQYNGTLGLWVQCITVPEPSHWFKPPTPDVGHRRVCVYNSLLNQFDVKYVEIGNHNSQVDYLRTYLSRSQFLLPLVSLSLMCLGAAVGLCACACRHLGPIIAMGVLHVLAGVCTLASVGCFVSNLELLHARVGPSLRVTRFGAYGWSFCLACVSAPLQLMAGALFSWAGHAQRREYSRVQAYRMA